jgi:hypothetical protein
MKLSTKLLYIAALVVLVIPLMFITGNTNAAVFNPDGAIHDATTGGWVPPAVSAPSNYNNCLACHQTGGSSIYAKESYLKGGHKNMSRPADGKPWGMPGVDATHAFTGDSAEAGIDPLGLFTELWTQEDYPRWSVNWTATSTTSTVTGGYCGTALGVTGTGDVPDLAACTVAGIECESPIMGNGGAGYPLGYPTQALCESAKKPSTGAVGYVWTPSATYPLYWIYGGAGLEGGPPMMEPGTQQYKCGRCHTTGWTADGNTAGNPAKHPWSDGLPTGATVIGGTTKLTKTSTSTSSDYSSWDEWGIQCSRCHTGATNGNHGDTTISSLAGGDIVALCMSCHRQESDTKPRGGVGTVVVNLATGATNTTDLNITPYTNKQAQPDGFAHHPDGDEFLNSPHAKFTGQFKDIGCPPYAINGYTAYAAGNEAANLANPGAPTACTPGAMNLDGSTSSLYASKFAQAAKILGDSDSAAGSCVTCHDVHQPLNENIAGMSQSVKTECTECHSNPLNTVSPQIDLSTIAHPSGTGTPLENAATDPTSACEICHQPAGIMHLWRIKADASYNMYGDYTHVDPPSGNVNLSSMANDSTGYSAMWVDLDNACGQCHGGGVSETDVVTATTAAISGKTYSITVADVTGFASGKEIEIIGAGQGGADFKTIIASVVKDADPAVSGTVYLTYPTAVVASAALGAEVIVPGNPTANGAPYIKKNSLADYANEMHNGNWPVMQPMTAAKFTYTNDSTTSYKVNVDAGTSACPNSITGCTYSWDFDNDGVYEVTGSVLSTASNTYSNNTSKIVKLTVKNNDSHATASTTKAVTPTAANTPPVAGFTPSVNGSIVTLTDSSTGASKITVKWGDGASNTYTVPLPTMSHTYATTGTFKIAYTVKSAAGLYNTSIQNVAVTGAKYNITVNITTNPTGSSEVFVLRYNGSTKDKGTGIDTKDFGNRKPSNKWTVKVRLQGYSFDCGVGPDVWAPADNSLGDKIVTCTATQL